MGTVRKATERVLRTRRRPQRHYQAFMADTHPPAFATSFHQVGLFTRAQPSAAGDASGRRCTCMDGAQNAQPRLATCFLRHIALQRAHIVAFGLQEATVLFVAVTKLILDKHVSDVFIRFACKIFTSDTRVRCSRQHSS